MKIFRAASKLLSGFFLNVQMTRVILFDFCVTQKMQKFLQSHMRTKEKINLSMNNGTHWFCQRYFYVKFMDRFTTLNFYALFRKILVSVNIRQLSIIILKKTTKIQKAIEHSRVKWKHISSTSKESTCSRKDIAPWHWFTQKKDIYIW